MEEGGGDLAQQDDVDGGGDEEEVVVENVRAYNRARCVRALEDRLEANRFMLADAVPTEVKKKKRGSRTPIQIKISVQYGRCSVFQ